MVSFIVELLEELKEVICGVEFKLKRVDSIALIPTAVKISPFEVFFRY